MGKMKKIMVLLLAMFVLLSVAGCGKEQEAKDSKTVEMHADKDLENDMKTAKPILNEKSGLDLKIVITPDYTAYQTNIQQSLGTNNAPGIFTWWAGSQLETLVKNDMVEDLTDQWNKYYLKNGVSEEVAKALTVDGKIYGAPLNIIYNGVYYNKEIFEKYGLKEPTTFEEFLALCETLKKKGITPIGIGNTWQSFSWPQALMGSMDPDLYDEWTSGKIQFTDKRVKKVFYQWIDMVKKGYFSKQEQDQPKDFATGKVAMIYNATNLLPGFRDEYGMKAGKTFDIFTLPSATAEQKSTIFYEVAPFLVAKNSDQKENAKKILQHYYEKDVQQAYADKTGTSSISSVEMKDSISKKMSEQANDTTNYNLKLRYYEQFAPAVVNLSIDEYWKIFANPTKEQVDKSLEAIQKEQDKQK
ncbi:ABC transporter substrate-binding protein [Pseudalkalibacillus sp. A8]|uniref:ABC transporter substrate-binding protein n=1 Tax=Pseudalkalibacillus sp. A8 TaxID=3382641 RepID=UPI0038B496D8